MVKSKKKKKITEQRKEDIILTEYQKAQDSAEHYNTMVWTLISVGIGFSFLMLKVVLLDLKEGINLLIDVNLLQESILLLGATSLVFFGILIRGANQKKMFKYEICKKIELEDKRFIGNNLGTEFLPLTKGRWGLPFFILMKNILLIFYLAFGFITMVKSVSINQFNISLTSLTSLTSLFLFLGILFIFVVDFFLDSSGNTKFEDVLLKIEGKRQKSQKEKDKLKN